MSCSNKYAAKIVTALMIFIGVSFLLMLTGSAGAAGISEDINNLADRANQTTDTFMRETLSLRIRLEFNGELAAKQDRQNLYELAKNASENLRTIAEIQQALKNKIEGHEGDDWDARYGSTGLWRKLFAELYRTALNKCQIDFYLALATKQPERSNILSEILTRLDSFDAAYHSVNWRFLKAKTTVLLAQTELVYKPSAVSQLDSLMAEPNTPRPIYFRAALEKIKLLGQTRPGSLETLTSEIAGSSCADDIELILSLAFLQRQLNYPEPFERIVQLFPQAEDFLGSVILSDIARSIAQRQNLQQISIFEAELAAQTAWRNNTEDYKELLGELSSIEKFQTPLILYVTAVSFADSSPAEAVSYLIKASKSQYARKSNKLDIEAETIARQAALLAYSLLVQKSIDCRAALEAFENYCAMTGERIDGQLQYLYSIVLNDCGSSEKANELLKKVAGQAEGDWSDRAKLELIIHAVQQNQLGNQGQREKLLTQLSTLISQCAKQNEATADIRTEAINIYCQLLLESEDRTEAQKVLDILADAEPSQTPNINILKSRALRQLGRLNESADYLLQAGEPNDYGRALEAMKLLSEIIDQIDQLQHEASDFPRLMKNCKRIAEYCQRTALSTYGYIPVHQSHLYLAEITILADAKQEGQLPAVEKLLDGLDRENDVNYLRCRARLLTEQGKFADAAQFWTEVCEIRKAESPSPNQRSWKWWRAKFYHLHCLAKCPQIEKKNLLHTIEVLESSFTEIPPLWVEKLGILKESCRSQVANADNSSDDTFFP